MQLDMTMLLETSGLKKSVEDQLISMRKQLSANQGRDFDRQLGRREGQLQSRYDITVLSSRGTDDFEQVRQMWGDLLAFSTFVRDQVHALANEHSARPHDLSLFDQIQDTISSRCSMLGLNGKHQTS
jgi:hypothetical protein